MNEIRALIQHIAPTLASALAGPFSGVAINFMSDNLAASTAPDGREPEDIVKNSLKDVKNLPVLKDIDDKFKQDMNRLGVDVFSLEHSERGPQKASNKPQVIISILFLTAYFLMLSAIFAVEISDSTNMLQGANSLMGELQILFGVLTAGVGQILSYWFGGLLGKNDAAQQ